MGSPNSKLQQLDVLELPQPTLVGDEQIVQRREQDHSDGSEVPGHESDERASFVDQPTLSCGKGARFANKQEPGEDVLQQKPQPPSSVILGLILDVQSHCRSAFGTGSAPRNFIGRTIVNTCYISYCLQIDSLGRALTAQYETNSQLNEIGA